MANGWRVVLFIGTGQYGPGEVWHWLNDSASLGLAAQAAIGMVQARLPLMVASYAVLGIRVSKEGQPRRAWTLLPGGVYNLEGTVVQVPATLNGKINAAGLDPHDSILVRVTGSNNNGTSIRNWYLSGAPDGIGGETLVTGNIPLNVGNGGIWLPALIGQGNPPAGGFLQYMNTNGWGFLGQSLAAGNLAFPVLGFTNQPAPSGLLGVETNVNAPNPVTPGKVHVTGATTIQRGLPSVNKQWPVQMVVPPVAPSTVQTIVLAGSGYLVAGNFKQPTGSTKVKVVALDEFKIVGMNAIKQVARKRGGGGLRPRGRRLTHL